MRCTEDELNQESMALSHMTLLQIILTFVMLAAFAGIKRLYDRVRRDLARLTVVVIGAGPIGLTAALITSQSKRVSNIIIYEEQSRHFLINRYYQVAFDRKTISFLKQFRVDFDNMEGCWQNECFFTRAGIYLEYVLDSLMRIQTQVDFHLNTKFTPEIYKQLEKNPGRTLVIMCDGSSGQTARVLGLSDESEQLSCGSYGAVAAIERKDQRLVPTPERRAHNLRFDLTAYGGDTFETDNSPGFSVKIFGNSRHRYVAIAIVKCESPLLKALRTILDRSLMRNIFLTCFNRYKNNGEPSISDSFALNHMKFSPRLFEIKLSRKQETVAYFGDSDMFVATEGDAAITYNFHTGMDINVGIRGLMSLPAFIDMVAWAETEFAIMKALTYKMNFTDQICKEFLKSGLKEYILS